MKKSIESKESHIVIGSIKQKIALLIHNMTGGGAERFVSHLLANLKDEFEIHLILFDDTIEYDLPEGQIVTFVEKGFKRRSNLASIARLPLAAFRLKKYCQANGIQLVFSFLNRPNFTACIAKLAGLRLPLMMNECTNTQLWFDERDLRGKIAKRIVALLYPQADIILPISEANRRSLEEYYGIKTRYQVITNVVDLADIQKRRVEAVGDVSFDRFTFINLASFSPMKGHKMMVDAFRRLGRDDAQLLFVGKGIQLDEIRELVHSLGLEKNILFPGFQRNPFKYLGKADCFVFGSDFEGQGAVLMEAMACGLPVVSTDCETGPRDLLSPGTDSKFSNGQSVEHGQYGILVPVGSAEAMAAAMREMMDKEELRTLYRERGYERVPDFDKGPALEKIRHIILELLSEQGDRR